jgi:hypothetical protein
MNLISELIGAVGRWRPERWSLEGRPAAEGEARADHRTRQQSEASHARGPPGAPWTSALAVSGHAANFGHL